MSLGVGGRGSRAARPALRGVAGGCEGSITRESATGRATGSPRTGVNGLWAGGQAGDTTLGVPGTPLVRGCAWEGTGQRRHRRVRVRGSHHGGRHVRLGPLRRPCPSALRVPAPRLLGGEPRAQGAAHGGLQPPRRRRGRQRPSRQPGRAQGGSLLIGGGECSFCGCFPRNVDPQSSPFWGRAPRVLHGRYGR
jgi:hypothetical protein